MSSATCEAFWLRRILEDIGGKQTKPTKVYCDNQTAFKLAPNPVYHSRTKHIEMINQIVIHVKIFSTRSLLDNGDSKNQSNLYNEASSCM